MSATVVFSDRAVSDLNAIVDYISIGNERRGNSFVRELSSRIVNKLSIVPESGIKIGEFRYAPFNRYVALYSYDATIGVVTIVMVMEGHRNWRQQFEEPS